MRLLAALSLMLVLSAPGSAAPLGRSFTYQGELTLSGTPVDGTVHLRFSLWDAAGTGQPPTGGTQIGSSQIVTDVPIDAGLFSVEINGADQFGAQAFNGQARWLQIDVCTDGTCSSTTVLGPRQALTAAPYALGPWQLGATGLGYTDGNVGVGTTSPLAPLHVKRVVPSVILQDMATTSNQAGYISYRNDTLAETGWVGYGTSGSPHFSVVNVRPAGDVVLHTAAGPTVVAKSTGSVGIGTSTPAGKLDVRGSIKVGTSGEYFVPGAEADLRIVRGVVANTGVAVFGTGFSSIRTGTGVYAITFDTPFVDQPSITATVQHASLDRIAILSTHLAGSCTIRVVSGSGTAVDATVDFIAIGRR